ncbi:MAG TPA: PPOX class F420-dependent oxidoreductase [Actinomycetales bacterium]
MSLDPQHLPPVALEFLRERHLATLTTLRRDGSPHVVPVGFTWDQESHVARIITGGDSVKARNAMGGGRASVCQVDGWRWLTLEGPVSVLVHPDPVADAVRRYTERYRVPRVNPARVVLQIEVDRALGLVERPAPRS